MSVCKRDEKKDRRTKSNGQKMNVLLQCDGDKALLLHSGKRVRSLLALFLLLLLLLLLIEMLKTTASSRSQIENKTSEGISYIFSFVPIS